MPKCPYCEKNIVNFAGRKETVDNIRILVLFCPHCYKVLGAVNAEQEGEYHF
jgi:hypothetical protein